jgi:hypothetical protein
VGEWGRRIYIYIYIYNHKIKKFVRIRTLQGTNSANSPE